MNTQAQLSAEWEKQLHLDRKGRLRPWMHNIAIILENREEWRGVFAYCKRMRKVIKLRNPAIDGWVDSVYEPNEDSVWTSYDTIRLKLWLSRNYCLHPSNTEITEAVRVVAAHTDLEAC